MDTENKNQEKKLPKEYYELELVLLAAKSKRESEKKRKKLSCFIIFFILCILSLPVAYFLLLYIK